MDMTYTEYRKAYEHMWDLIRAMPLTREGYEATCRELGITPMSDAELYRISYALKYGDFSGVADQLSRPVHCAWLDELERQRQAAAFAKITVPPANVVADCGHICAETVLMHASLGTSCPDCYDRMSGEE